MKERIINTLLILSGTLLLIAVAFYNKYPLVYSDTSTYLASGFELEAPFDRPITYGLFLRLTSLNGFSLWSVIFIQSLILSYLIVRILGNVLGQQRHSFLIKIAAFFFLSIFTGISWTSSQVIPDIFTPISILCAAIILTGKIRGWELYFLYFLFLLASAMNMSHIIFNITFFAFILVFRSIKSLPLRPVIKFQPVLILVILTLVSILTMGSALSKSKHVFFMGAMVEHGITKVYLDDNCDANDYKLCAYKDSLNLKAYEFVWEKYSPFYKIGGWKETKEEFNEIIWNTLTTPKYIVLHIRESIKATLDQLMKFRIGDGNGPFLSGTKLYERINNYIPRESIRYENSLQNLNKLKIISKNNKMINFIMMLSIVCLCFLFTRKKVMSDLFFIYTLLFLTGIIINAWVSGTFGNAIDRFGCKVMWLLPFLAFIGTVRYLNHYLSASSHNPIRIGNRNITGL